MSRIERVGPRQAGPLTGMVLRLARRKTRQLTGRETEWMIGPLEAYAQRPRLLLGYGMLEDATARLEEDYARAETPVVSNNSAHRWTADVPMMIPELNADHAAVIEAQRRRLGTRRGFITVKPNCSLQSYVPAIHPLLGFGPTKIAVCTYQAISGAGKTFETWPEMIDNVIPFIPGEEEKSEKEPLKVWGSIACRSA